MGRDVRIRYSTVGADDGMARFEALKLIAPPLSVGDLVDALGRAGRERNAWFLKKLHLRCDVFSWSAGLDIANLPVRMRKATESFVNYRH
jgi:hypothetical protein